MVKFSYVSQFVSCILFFIQITGCKTLNSRSIASETQNKIKKQYAFKEPYTYKKTTNKSALISASEFTESTNNTKLNKTDIEAFASNNNEIIVQNSISKAITYKKIKAYTEKSKLTTKTIKSNKKRLDILDEVIGILVILGGLLMTSFATTLLFYFAIVTAFNGAIGTTLILIALTLLALVGGIAGTIIWYVSYRRKKTKQLLINQQVKQNYPVNEEIKNQHKKEPAPKTTEQKLRNVKTMYDEGLISEEEFKLLKTKIISEDQ